MVLVWDRETKFGVGVMVVKRLLEIEYWLWPLERAEWCFLFYKKGDVYITCADLVAVFAFSFVPYCIIIFFFFPFSFCSFSVITVLLHVLQLVDEKLLPLVWIMWNRTADLLCHLPAGGHCVLSSLKFAKWSHLGQMCCMDTGERSQHWLVQIHLPDNIILTLNTNPLVLGSNKHNWVLCCTGHSAVKKFPRCGRHRSWINKL